MVPKMFEIFPPVTRPRILDVAKPESLRKFAMLWLGTLKSLKLWNRFAPPPGLVPPVMSYCTFPAGGAADRLTCVLSPDGVIGGWARVTEHGRTRRSERTNMTLETTFACSRCGFFMGCLLYTSDAADE